MTSRVTKRKTAPAASKPSSTQLTKRHKATDEISQPEPATDSVSNDNESGDSERDSASDINVDDGVDLWDDHDDIRLDAMQSYEYTLWRRCKKLFNLSPLDLLPDGEEVDISENMLLPDENGSRMVKPNWSSAVVTDWLKVLCIPVFKGRADFFRYTVQLCQYYRLGAENGKSKPSKSVLSSERDQRLATALKDLVGVQSAEIVTKVADRVWGRDRNLPPHSGFVKLIKGAVRQYNRPKKTQLGLVSRDFAALWKAWDEYAKLPANNGELKTADVYQDSVGRDKKRVLNEEAIKQWKKSCVVASRRGNRAPDEASARDDIADESEDLEVVPEIPSVVATPQASSVARKAVSAAPVPANSPPVDNTSRQSTRFQVAPAPRRYQERTPAAAGTVSSTVNPRRTTVTRGPAARRAVNTTPSTSQNSTLPTSSTEPLSAEPNTNQMKWDSKGNGKPSLSPGVAGDLIKYHFDLESRPLTGTKTGLMLIKEEDDPGAWDRGAWSEEPPFDNFGIHSDEQSVNGGMQGRPRWPNNNWRPKERGGVQ